MVLCDINGSANDQQRLFPRYWMPSFSERFLTLADEEQRCPTCLGTREPETFNLQFFHCPFTFKLHKLHCLKMGSFSRGACDTLSCCARHSEDIQPNIACKEKVSDIARNNRSKKVHLRRLPRSWIPAACH